MTITAPIPHALAHSFAQETEDPIVFKAAATHDADGRAAPIVAALGIKHV